MNQSTPSATRPGLLRVLGPVMGTAIVVGTVIGSGVFKKAQVVSASVPNFGWAAASWIAIGILALLGGLTIAEVASLYPRAGGAYVFLREGYGRLAGFLWGWVEFWIIRSASIAALATIFSESFLKMLRDPALAARFGYSPNLPGLQPVNEVYVTLAVIFGLALVNMRGVKWGGLLQLFITLVKVGSLLFIVALPFFLSASAVANPDPLPDKWKTPPESITVSGLATALLGVLWAYHGWMNIAPVAGEIKNPHRNVPLSLIGGVGIIIALYLGANFAYAWVIPQDQMANVPDGTPVATEFSVRLLGSVGTVLMSAVIMCSVFGALNGNILVGPRVLYAMGKDGFVPTSLGRAHPRYHTPTLGIIVLTIWSMLLVSGVAVLERSGALEAKAPFDVLTDFAMFGVVIFETMAVLTIFVFRRRFPQVQRPYRCWGYPYTPALYVLLPALILGNMFFSQRLEAMAGSALIGLGAMVYAFVLDAPAKREPHAVPDDDPGG